MAEKRDPKGWVEGLDAFPPKDVERDVSTPLEDRASQDGSSYSDEQEYLPKPEDLYRPTNSPLPNIAEPKPDSPCSTPPPDYRSPDIPDLPMSPPPSYQKFEDKTALATGSRTALATGYQPKFDPAQRPKKKQLYEDSEMPKEEVELMSINPRRISYHEEPPIDEGPTRDTYRESSLGATADPIVMDKDISDLPPGVEEKFPPPQSITLSETTSRPERDVERGRREPASETYECTSFGRMNPAFTRVARFTLRRKEGVCSSSTRLLIFIGATLGILSLIVFLGVFPNSFVYVEHYEIALLKNTFTGTVYRDVTYHPGCYVLGPEREFVTFPGSAVFVSFTEAIFTRDKLEITVTFHFQYFLRPLELGELHKKYGLGYQDIIKSVVRSRIKNSAVILSLDDFRFNRTMVERTMFNIIKSRLTGNCCPDCCPSCSNATVCSICDSTPMCDPVYHVDIRYFQMAKVVIADDVAERYLTSLLLKVRAEAEFFKQNHTVIEKKTEQMVKQRQNEANELIRAGEAQGAATMVIAEAKREANITTGYAVALWTMYNRLGITNMDHKLSLMMVRTLEDVNVKGNLYRRYNYDNMTLVNMGTG